MGRFNFTGDTESASKPQLEFIEKILNERGFKGPDVLIEQVGEAGDNYIANVKRVIITENGSTFKMIAKLAPTNPMLRLMGNLEMMFNNEHVIYTEVFPKFREIQKNAGVPKEDLFKFPECYGSNIEHLEEVILLEDLREDNYVMLDRFKPLNYNTVKIVLKNLALYHSLSYVLKHREPNVFIYFVSKLKDMAAQAITVPELFFMWEQMENFVMDIIENEKHKKFLKGSTTKMAEYTTEVIEHDTGSKYSIIQQGDGWTNNFLFQMDVDFPKSCILIDYQMAKESNPAYDIMFMLFNSTNHELRQKHYHEFINYYHEEMEKSLKYFDIEINSVYPREQLDADIKRYSKYMLGVCVMASSFITKKPEDASKFKETIENHSLESIKDDVDKFNETMLGQDEETLALLKSKIEGLIDSFVEFGLLKEH